MVFSDPSFLFYFLPIVLFVYWLGAWRQRNLFLLFVSLAFYTSGGGRLVLLLVGSASLTFGAALAIEKTEIGNRKQVVQRVTVVALLASLLGMEVRRICSSTVIPNHSGFGWICTFQS